jgi:FAD/FMN-containing dehydrogenase
VSTTISSADAAREALPGFGGQLIGPDDSSYDEARAVYNAMIDRRPALIARCTSAEDAARVIGFAREHDLRLAIRGGGHNGAGLGTVDDGVVIDLSPLRTVEVDPEARTVRAGGGCRWADVDTATGEYGLATPSGIISTTGVGGLTLGGGLGHLTRKCGLAIDNLLEAEVVLANLQVVQASAESHPDLFWALRGGGGNFGVVTSFKFRLHDVGTVVAGPTFWPVEDGAEVLSAYREFLPSAPRELSGFFAFHTVPPAPPFPEAIHLRKVCGVVWCYVGPEDAAATAMKPFLDSVPEPLLHGPGPAPHAALQSAFDGLYPPGDQWYWRADFVNEIPDEAVKLHARFGEAMPTMKSTMHMYPIDGAAHDIGPSDTAWGYRDARWGSVFAGVDPDPANLDAIRRWSIDYQEALHPYSAGGAYMNMMMEEGQERVRASYRDNYDRLASIKATYDPDNTFRVNQNIQPKE